ncbi:AraC family transcriptional regulator ligand-binding domain-containing protein [Cupriavidus basilensis]
MISADSVGWLLEESARLSGQEGLRIAARGNGSLANLGMLALVLRKSQRCAQQMQSCVRHMRLHNAGVQLRLKTRGDVVLLHMGANTAAPVSGARLSNSQPASDSGCSGR